MKQPGFLYFGRLEQEKWFDLILEAVRMFLEKWELKFSLFVFGAGSYEKDLKELAEKSKNIHFFGRKNLDEIKRYIWNCEYCLMPSVFLETFGLTALTAISWGLPVIGFKKWWVVPFLSDDLDINKYKWNSDSQKLFNCIDNILNNKAKLEIPKININNYSKEQWIIRFLPLINKHKKILLVSDFVNKVGWIETYIHDVQKLLIEQGFEVEIWGGKLPKWRAGKIKKLFGIWWGLANFVSAIKLKIFCKKWEPDIIWYHSTLRWLGWMPVWAGKSCAKERWMMYHDFGYFFPFPQKLTKVEDVKTPLNARNFVAMSKSKNPIKKLFVWGKYLSLSALKKSLSSVDKHLVPSDFMIDIVHNSHKIPKEKISSLEHFLQE